MFRSRSHKKLLNMPGKVSLGLLPSLEDSVEEAEGKGRAKMEQRETEWNYNYGTLDGDGDRDWDRDREILYFSHPFFTSHLILTVHSFYFIYPTPASQYQKHP
jgi:hypothetical protein